MGIVNDIFNSFRFKDTIFYKSDSDLQERFDVIDSHLSGRQKHLIATLKNKLT